MVSQLSAPTSPVPARVYDLDMNQTDRLPDTPPRRHCDVIMKGGITSGVVYPSAGVELAKRFTLKSIGGASAGAIAAAFFAAAEHRRSALGSNAGFAELETYPGKFGATTSSGTSFLLSLFQPAKEARRAFRLLLAFLGPDRWRKFFRVLRDRHRAHTRWRFCSGSLPGAAFLASGAPLRVLSRPPRALHRPGSS